MTSILKFGGTSVESIDKIKAIANYIKDRYLNGESLVVVVSAMGKSTDHLVKLIHSLDDQPSKRELDMLLATGEQVTIPLLSTALKNLGVNAISLTGGQAGILTNDHHAKARIEGIDTDLIQMHLQAGTVVVVAGFQGISATGDITTLGRGGSDTTAVALAVALKGTCEIYTDVTGIFTVDPKHYPNARQLESISYDEMLEMASLGSNVLETRAVEMAHKFDVPLYVAKSLDSQVGTHILSQEKLLEIPLITGISVDDTSMMASVKNLPFSSKNIASLFEALSKKHINIDMISIAAPYNDHVTISFSALKADLLQIQEVISKMSCHHSNLEITSNDQITKLSVVGIGMVSHSGVAASIFNLFAKYDIRYYQVTTSEISISYSVHQSDIALAVKVISEYFKL
jgi:aspartate kinase